MRKVIHYTLGLIIIALPIALMIPTTIVIAYSDLHIGKQLALMMFSSLAVMWWYTFWFDKD